MPDRPVHVHLEASPTEETTADGIVTEFTILQRALRAGILFFICVIFAGMILAIPIVHLIGVPLLLVTGIALGIKQFSATERLRPMKMACPKCGGTNRLGGGIGRRSLDEPMDRACENCRRGLVLRLEPMQRS